MMGTIKIHTDMEKEEKAKARNYLMTIIMGKHLIPILKVYLARKNKNG